MTKYLNPSLVKESFDRLAPKISGGKAHLERTSSILYFLAFDAVCHRKRETDLDLDPDRLTGKNNRKELELEFTKLVLLGNENGKSVQFLEFGRIDTSDKTPEKRISANFFTVPLKRATTESQPFYYPSRPRAPLLMLGAVATKKKWGVACHEDFENNFFVVLSTARSSTPAFDLAVVILRDVAFPSSAQELYTALSEELSKKFTPRLVILFKKRIEKEKILIKSKYLNFVDHYSSLIDAEKKKASLTTQYESMSREELIAEILKLRSKN